MADQPSDFGVGLSDRNNDLNRFAYRLVNEAIEKHGNIELGNFRNDPADNGRGFVIDPVDFGPSVTFHDLKR